MAIGDVNSNEPGSGARFNDGKVRYELIPTHLLDSTARVLEFGTKKYAPWNWAKGMPWSVVIGCLKRHIAAIERGEDIDPESGQRHTGHIGANLLFLEHYMNTYPEMDDRPKEWFNNKKETDDATNQPTNRTEPRIGAVYPLVLDGVSDLRPHLQQAHDRVSQLKYWTTDSDGIEYWTGPDGGVVRYGHTGARLD